MRLRARHEITVSGSREGASSPAKRGRIEEGASLGDKLVASAQHPPPSLLPFQPPPPRGEGPTLPVAPEAKVSAYGGNPLSPARQREGGQGRGLNQPGKPLFSRFSTLRGGIEHLGPASERLGRKPERLYPVPERLGREPQSLGQAPQSLGREPERLGQAPEGLGQQPEGLGQRPERLGQASERFGQEPESPGQAPESLGTVPERLGKPPEWLGIAPERPG